MATQTSKQSNDSGQSEPNTKSTVTDTSSRDSSTSNTDTSSDPNGAPLTGGISPGDGATNVPRDPFDTKGSEPVRDREADPKKGRPVTRYFTKDGTPVEPSTVPPAATPSNLAGHDASKRDDVVPVVEYLDDDGATVTHDSLEAKQKQDKKDDNR